MSSPLEIPGAKRTLFVALVMTFIGFVGLTLSMRALGAGPDQLAQANPSATPELQAAWLAFAEALMDSPVRHALAVANLLASGLLLVASFSLTGRARGAIWWTTQALVANLAYTLGWIAGNAYLVQANRAQLLELARLVMEAQSAPTDGVEGVPAVFVAVMVGLGTIPVLVYLGLWRMTRREDVRRFVAREV